MHQQDISPQINLVGVFLASELLYIAADAINTMAYKQNDIQTHITYHMSVEFFSIIVAIAIFGLGWNTYRQTKDTRSLFLSCSLMAIGLIEFMHVLSYPEMPQFVTPNSMDKTTQFWLIARLFAAAAFAMSALIRPETQSRILTKSKLTAAAIALPALAFAWVIYYPNLLHIGGSAAAGYLPLGILAIAFAGNWRLYADTKDRTILYFLAAMVASGFGELTFILHEGRFDAYSMLGHIYQLTAFLLIYKSIFMASVQQPYEKIDSYSRALKGACEKLAEEDRYKREIMRIISHEIKTPLVPIIGYAEMLKRSKGLSKEQKREIDAIYRNSLRTVDLTKKMEMLSKVEGGAIRQSLEKEDAAGIIEKTCKELGLYASTKKIDIRILVQKNMPKINMDQQVFTTVLENLLLNSIKFTNPGGNILVGAEYDKSKDTATFWVKDTGIGIKKEDMKKIFTPFYQEDMTLSRRHEGAGLGLSICKRMVQASGGKIWIESKPGKGTKVTFTIPDATKELKGN